jgi:pimeloyl-ACP methyl ester carboxylesterase
LKSIQIYFKLSASDCKGDIETRFSKDDLLTFITIYWATQTINSSIRIYYEAAKNPWLLSPTEKITVPCAIAGFTHDNVPLREWAERFYNIQRWNEFDRGGHFPAFEEPELLSHDIREFFCEQVNR